MIAGQDVFRAWRGAGIALAAFATMTAPAAAETGMLSAGPAPAPSATYVPQRIALQNLSPAGGKLCVVGYSQQKTGVAIGNYDPITVPAYSLTRDARQTVGVWSPMTPGNIVALEVGAEITQAALTPSRGRYLNAGTLTFFYVKSPPSGFKCSSIYLTVVDSTAGTVNTPNYPYPRSLFEASVYPVYNAATNTYTVQATVDTSNVDSFELPIQVNVAKFTQVQPPTTPTQWRMSPVAYFGNPVTTNGVSRRTLISGADDKGGASSPLYKWLKQTPQAGVADSFLKLAYGTDQFPYAMIESPNDHLNLKCAFTNPHTPKGCTQNNELLNLRDPLNSYFDAELKTFFSNAVNASTGMKLAVMGDASGAIASEPWIAQTNRYSCPLYLNPDKSSIAFKNQSGTRWMALCNPWNQVLLFNPTAADLPPQVTVTPGGFDPSFLQFGILPPLEVLQLAVATFTVTAQQCKDAQTRGRLGWNLGQPETNFVVRITKIDCSANTFTGAVVAPPSGAVGDMQQSYDFSSSGVPAPNPSFKNWIYSNIPWAPGVNWSESASQMVFANDGAFAAWQSVVYASDADLMTVSQSVARNIVEAFNRGVANCNNVTMSPTPTTGPCAKVVGLTSSQMNPSSAATASDAFWSNEANFYPTGGVQNYYAQYLHAASVPLSAGATSVSLPPRLPISVSARSNQGITMGMAYGFAYDENPGYLKLNPTDIPNVPSKLDPIPASWWPAPKDGYMILGVVIGKSD